MSAHGLFYRKIRSKSTLFYVGILFLICFASLNVLYSQSFPPFMWDVVEQKPEAVIVYLDSIPNTKQYSLEMKRMENDNNTTILNTLHKREVAKNTHIHTLSEMAKTYPHNPELYYNLSLLYKDRGIVFKSSTLLKKAQSIDPGIGQ